MSSDSKLDLHLLICEDRADDVELMIRELQCAGIAPALELRRYRAAIRHGAG